MASNGLVDTVPIWLAPHSQTQGWIGSAREELDLDPALHFYTQDGHAYAAAPGEAIQPLAESAPPYTLTQTFTRLRLANRVPAHFSALTRASTISSSMSASAGTSR